MRHTLIPTSLALSLFAGCSTAPGIARVDLDFALDSSLRATGWQGVDADGELLTVQAARITLRRIDLELPPGVVCDPTVLEPPVFCGDDGTEHEVEFEADRNGADDGTPDQGGEVGEAEGGSIEIEGPFVIDLDTGTVDPPLTDLTLPEGVYAHVDLRLDTDAAGGGPSFEAKGTFADGAPWTLALPIDEDARFEAPGGIEIQQAADVLVLLDVAQWFADAPVSSCRAEGLLAESGGTIWLDDSAGCDLLDPIEDAIKESGRVEDHTEVENEVESETETETETGTED